MRAALEHSFGQILGQQMKVGTLICDHTALAGTVDHHQDHAGIVRAGAGDMHAHAFAIKIGHDQIAEDIRADLADKAGRLADPRDPGCDIRGRAARRQRDPAGGIATGSRMVSGLASTSQTRSPTAMIGCCASVFNRFLE